MGTPAPTDTSNDGRAALDPERLRNDLDARGVPVRQLAVVAETGSTNADLIARAAGGEDVDGVLLLAEHQTAGRGRNGRTWSAVPGAQVTMSFGVSAQHVAAQVWGWIPLITGLAVLDAVSSTGVEAGLKWPNDVLARPPAQGKLAGILAEVTSSGSTIVVGVGLNVSFRADELPDPGATSLALLGGRLPDRCDLVVELLAGLTRRIAALRTSRGPGAALLAEYAANSLTIGTAVKASLPGDREIVGLAHGVDDVGRLRIETDDAMVTVAAGDITHLRPQAP